MYIDVFGVAHFIRTDKRMKRMESGYGKASEIYLAHLRPNTVSPNLAHQSMDSYSSCYGYQSVCLIKGMRNTVNQ